jgi:hypothetical protein
MKRFAAAYTGTMGRLVRAPGVCAGALSSARSKHAKFILNLDDPDASVAAVREVRERYLVGNARHSSGDLQALINVAMAHYAKGDYRLARACAVYAHDIIVEEKGPTAYLAYFSAVTALKCCEALHNHAVEERELRASGSLPVVTTMVAGKQGLTLDDVTKRLEKEMELFRAAADRVVAFPRNMHIRDGMRNKRKASGWDDSDCSSATGERGGGGENRRHRSETDERRRNRRAPSGRPPPR